MFFFVNRLPRFAIRCANANDSLRIMSQKRGIRTEISPCLIFAELEQQQQQWDLMLRMVDRKWFDSEIGNRILEIKRIGDESLIWKRNVVIIAKNIFFSKSIGTKRGLFLPRFADGRCCCKVKAMKQRHQAAQIKIMDYLLKILTIKHFLMLIYS